MRFPLIEKYHDMYMTNHSDLSDLPPTFRDANHLNIQVVFMPSTTVEGFPIDPIFLPFHLPALDLQTDLEELRLVVTTHLEDVYRVHFPSWQQRYEYKQNGQWVRLQPGVPLCEMPGIQDGTGAATKIYLSEECGFDIKVVHDPNDCENALHVEVMADKIYMLLMVRQDVAEEAANYYGLQKQLAMFNEFLPCNSMGDRCFMPFSSLDYGELAENMCKTEIDLVSLAAPQPAPIAVLTDHVNFRPTHLCLHVGAIDFVSLPSHQHPARS